jgi:hypothetical protein
MDSGPNPADSHPGGLLEGGIAQPLAKTKISASKRWSILLGLLLSLSTGELLCRMLYFQKKTFDPEFGYVFQAGTKTVHFLEGYGISSWTQHGIRRAKSLPSRGESSILVLGDSFTEAVHVGDAEVFTQVLEEQLAQAGHIILRKRRFTEIYSLPNGWSSRYGMTISLRRRG